MGSFQSGALNASGFTESIKQKRLPHYTHITHNGIFNENYFSVGQKATSLMQLHYGIGVSNCHIAELPKKNYFLSLFLKSSTDG